MTTQDAGYAIVDREGRIVSLHSEYVPCGEGWGFDRELVELASPHKVGDVIAYDACGYEVEVVTEDDAGRARVGSSGERMAYDWARREQGFAGSFEDWLALSPEVRAEYEDGAAGIGTV